MPRLSDGERRETWYTQPVVWLGIAIFAATVIGCVYLIVVGSQYEDASVHAGPRVFGVPLRSAPPPSGPADPAPR